MLKSEMIGLKARLSNIEEKSTESMNLIKRISDTGEIRISPEKT